MSYDFTSILDRTGQDALALEVIPVEGATVQEGVSRIPMWIADMNFATVPCVPASIIARARHPAYGYFRTRQEYYDAILGWQRQQNGVQELEAKHIGYENGVLGGVVSALAILCSRGDAVLLHSPTYVGFTHVLENNGYSIVHSPLRKDADGVWRMDFADMEEKIVKHHIHAAIFCSPHNPSGRVWSKEELESVMAVYKKHDVYVISDEIWSDLTLNENHHTPAQSVSEDARMRTIALYAPSKTFNLAGLIGSYHIAYNPLLCDRLAKQGSLSGYNDQNLLSMHALIGAYSEEGRQWLQELRAVLADNIAYACRFIVKHFPGVEVSQPQGTYMLFLDCSKYCADTGQTMDALLRAGISVGVIWQDGRPFCSENAIRMNLALPKSLVVEAFDRLAKYVFHTL